MLTLNEYQEKAAATDPTEIDRNPDLTVLLLGLAGETGSLLTLYKKWLRDGDAYQVVEERLREEMGDILWYLAAISRRRGMSLETIAEENLSKTASRWLEPARRSLTDDGHATAELLPRSFVAELRDGKDASGRAVMTMVFNGDSLGDPLTDNSYVSDGYRFHDLFHLSTAAMLGWSPVLRKLLERKRKSDSVLDEVEDGGRAVAIEEGISALVFTYANQHSMLLGVQTIDWSILRTCSAMTSGLEAGKRELFLWEKAIIAAYNAWREALQYGGVRVRGDLLERTLTFESLRS